MDRHRINLSLIVGTLVLALCTSCASADQSSQESQVATGSTTQQQEPAESTKPEPTGYAAPAEAEGSNVLGGNWEVAAITYEDKIVPVDAVESLADLYDNVFLGFSKDGTFEYRRNVFITRGQYAPYEGKEDLYILKAETTSRATIDDGKITETEGEASEKAYLVATSDEAENALAFVEMDTSTGKTKEGESIVYFKKRGESSVFDKDKDSSKGSESDASDSSSGSSSSGSSSSGSSSSGSSSTGSGSGSTSYGSGNQQAVQRAQQYLRTSAFSHDGLVQQLEYEGFSHEDAVYGADACGADWMEQAAIKAKQYLQTMAFSESGLVEQLVYEGFTQAEAEHGVSLCGANWMEQAVKKARQYQSTMSMSYSRLVEQLEFEGFTHEQAVYGADNA